MTEQTFYVHRHGTNQGPFTQGEIDQRLQSGELSAGDFVALGKEWVPISTWQTSLAATAAPVEASTKDAKAPEALDAPRRRKSRRTLLIAAGAIVVLLVISSVPIFKAVRAAVRTERTADSRELIATLTNAGFKVEKEEGSPLLIGADILDKLDGPYNTVRVGKALDPVDGWRYRPGAQLRVDGKSYFAQNFDTEEGARGYCNSAEYFETEPQTLHDLKRYCWVFKQWAVMDLSHDEQRRPLLATSDSEISALADFSRVTGDAQDCAAMKACCVGVRLPPIISDKCSKLLGNGRHGSCRLALNDLRVEWSSSQAPDGCSSTGASSGDVTGEGPERVIANLKARGFGVVPLGLLTSPPPKSDSVFIWEILQGLQLDGKDGFVAMRYQTAVVASEYCRTRKDCFVVDRWSVEASENVWRSKRCLDNREEDGDRDCTVSELQQRSHYLGTFRTRMSSSKNAPSSP